MKIDFNIGHAYTMTQYYNMPRVMLHLTQAIEDEVWETMCLMPFSLSFNSVRTPPNGIKIALTFPQDHFADF